MASLPTKPSSLVIVVVLDVYIFGCFTKPLNFKFYDEIKRIRKQDAMNKDKINWQPVV
jgi:hypothetical protein